MHVTARVALAVLMALSVPGIGSAKCDPTTEPDRSDVAAARAAVAAVCECSDAVSHRAYVRCATAEAEAILANKGCVRVVKRCASKSTCGKPGYVTCCRTRSSGATSCTLKRDAARCTAPNGGSACVGAMPSCCDACADGGCSVTTTTTTATTTTIPFGPCAAGPGGTCGGFCPSIFEECVSGSGGCECVEVPCQGIGGIGSCGGSCPSPATCTFVPGGCACVAAP